MGHEKAKREMEGNMRVLSLFDGISCARVALERLGYKDITYYASEVDKYAIQIAQKNFPDTIQVGDITKLKGEDFKDIDLMIGGSPCQDLSIAKKDRQGLKGARSGLFFEYVRLLKEIKPKYFVLENVNSMPKEAKEQITKILGVEPIMINAALVSAQNRKRLFWVGKLVGDKYEQVEITQPEDRGILLKDIIESGDVDRLKSYAIDANYFKGGEKERIGGYTIDKRGIRPHRGDKKKTGISELGRILFPSADKTDALSTHHQPKIINSDKSYCLPSTYYKENVKSLVKRKKKGLTIRVGQFNSGGQGDRVYSLEGKSTTLSAQGGGRGAKTGLYLVAPNGKNIVLGDSELQVFGERRTELGKQSRKEIRELTGKDSTKRSKEHKEYFGKEGLKANCVTTGLGVEGLVAIIPEATKKGFAIAKDGDSVDLSFPTSNTGRGGVGNKAKNIMTSQNIGVFTKGIIRKLTPIECERLQSLNDEYTSGVSNTQRYKCLGNAFNVEVVKHILSFIK